MPGFSHRIEDSQATDPNRLLQEVTDDNVEEFQAEQDRHIRQRLIERYRNPIAICIVILLTGAALIAGYLFGLGDANERLDSLLSEQTADGQLLLQLEQKLDVAEAKVADLEEALAAAPTAEVQTELEMELEQAQDELAVVRKQLDDEIRELEQANAGLRSENGVLNQQNTRLESQNGRLESQRDDALSRATEAEGAVAANLAQTTTRLEALSLPGTRAEYVFEGENTVVRESFGVHFFGWNDSAHRGEVRGFAVFDLGDKPTSVEWTEYGESLRVVADLPRVSVAGLFNFDEDSIANESGWIARLFNRGDSAEVIMHLEQQVLYPHTCGDVESLRDHVEVVETEYATQARPYQVEVLWRGPDGQLHNTPSGDMLLGAAC